MLDHFFKIFVRMLLKNRAFSFINIVGLAVGLVCGIFTLVWVMDEFAFDSFHLDGENIFTIRTNASYPGGAFTFSNTSGRLADGLREFPEVEQAARSVFKSRLLVSYKDKSLYEDGIYSDASIFKIFTLPLVEGNSDNPLPDVSSIAISEKLAKKYFNLESAIGKIIRINNETDVRVTAVIKDLPAQSTLQFQSILPYSIYAKTDPYNQEWGAWTGGDTYVKLNPGTDIVALNKKISLQISHPKIWPRWGDNVEMFLFSLKDWHLQANFENGKQAGGRIIYVKGLSLIALFIVLIACINFMNLATARSISRSKEIGVRKVIGAARRSLIGQFLSESVLLSLISLSLALIVVHLLLPHFNSLTDKKILIDYTNPFTSSAFIGLALLTGLIAGSYPAFFLSSVNAVQGLKQKLSGITSVGVRRTLVVIQFSISTVLIVCGLLVYKQIQYMRAKNLGYDKENTFNLRASGNLQKNFGAFKQEVMSHIGIQSVSRASEEPMNIENGLEMPDDGWRGKTKEDNIAFQWLFCDHDFLQAFKFDLIEGRYFSDEFPSDSSNFIINEEAARRMKFSHPVGETLKADRKGTVIGLIKDFHSKGLDQPIQPVIISLRPENANQIFIHYEKGQLEEVMNQVKSAYGKLEPDFPFEFEFLDELFGRQYKSEILIERLSGWFVGIAVLVSCLGLFGLTLFTAERRIKEIGIRKVLGATVGQLVALLCNEFIRLILVSMLIGFPIAWWLGGKFLNAYAFRTDMGISIFAFTGFLLLAVTLITISYQSVKAALNNPVNCLRSE